MRGSTHAVVWREGNARARVGKLELAPRHLLLDGVGSRGHPSRRRIPYDALVAVRIGRTEEDRLDGRPTFVLERRAGRQIRISTVDSLGTLRELAERVASVTSAAETAALRRSLPGRRGERLRVLIAGGGVAALEAMLALRALASDRVAVELLAPESRFSYRPLAVAEPFGIGEVHRFELAAIASAGGARLLRGALTSVDARRHVARTSRGVELGYDVLLIGCGARTREALPGALTFRGSEDSDAVRALLADARAGRVRDLVFALPGGATWALPLYELALLTAADLAAHGATGVNVTLATHEEAPLALFGPAASEAIRELLEARGIALRSGVYPAAVKAGRLRLVPEGSLPADRVLALPRLKGPFIAGVPHTDEGFIPNDAFGRVEGAPDVFAAGDVTAFPVKQGGIAAQQADAAAEAIAAHAGAAVSPRPFRPVLRGLLLTGGVPRYLRAEMDGGHGETSTAATEPLWWPPGKIAGRHLAPFLAAWTGLAVPPAPPPGSGAVEVEIDLAARESPQQGP